MMTGTTSKVEAKEVFDRMAGMAGVRKGRKAGEADRGGGGPEIKLCYVTVSAGHSRFC